MKLFLNDAEYTGYSFLNIVKPSVAVAEDMKILVNMNLHG